MLAVTLKRSNMSLFLLQHHLQSRQSPKTRAKTAIVWFVRSERNVYTVFRAFRLIK